MTPEELKSEFVRHADMLDYIRLEDVEFLEVHPLCLDWLFENEPALRERSGFYRIALQSMWSGGVWNFFGEMEENGDFWYSDEPGDTTWYPYREAVKLITRLGDKGYLPRVFARHDGGPETHTWHYAPMGPSQEWCRARKKISRTGFFGVWED